MTPNFVKRPKVLFWRDSLDLSELWLLCGSLSGLAIPAPSALSGLCCNLSIRGCLSCTLSGLCSRADAQIAQQVTTRSPIWVNFCKKYSSCIALSILYFQPQINCEIILYGWIIRIISPILRWIFYYKSLYAIKLTPIIAENYLMCLTVATLGCLLSPAKCFVASTCSQRTCVWFLSNHQRNWSL